MSRAVRVSLILGAVSLLVAVVALVVALSPSPTERRQQQARAEGQIAADRIRSGTQIRQMVLAVHSYASNHDWNAPPPERWKQVLIEADMLTPEMFDVRGGQEVETPYHYIPPTRDELLAVTGQEAPASTRAASEVVVFYEDPGLWAGGGGHAVFLDSSAQWFDGPAYAELMERIGHP